MSHEGINVTTPLIDLGVDSLVAVEIRTWFAQEVGADVAVLKILGGPSIEDLVEDTIGKWTLQQEGEVPELDNDTSTALSNSGSTESLGGADLSSRSSVGDSKDVGNELNDEKLSEGVVVP
jgi:hypothetical protein